MIQQTNLGLVVQLKIREDNTFLYVFMALKASISGWQHCILIVIIDEIFLKSKYRGILLTASTQDAQGKIFPLAFYIADSENDDSWKWFFNNYE